MDPPLLSGQISYGPTPLIRPDFIWTYPSYQARFHMDLPLLSGQITYGPTPRIRPDFICTEGVKILLQCILSPSREATSCIKPLFQCRRVAKWVKSLDLTTRTSLSPIQCGFAKKGALDCQPHVIKFTSCLPMVGGSLRVLRLFPPLKLVAII